MYGEGGRGGGWRTFCEGRASFAKKNSPVRAMKTVTARGIFSRACHGAVPRVTRCRPVFFFRSRGVVVGEALGAHAPGSPSEAFLPLSMVSART